MCVAIDRKVLALMVLLTAVPPVAALEPSASARFARFFKRVGRCNPASSTDGSASAVCAMEQVSCGYQDKRVAHACPSATVTGPFLRGGRNRNRDDGGGDDDDDDEHLRLSHVRPGTVRLWLPSAYVLLGQHLIPWSALACACLGAAQPVIALPQ